VLGEHLDRVKLMEVQNDNSSLYGSPDGYEQVVVHYDRTIDGMGIPYENEYVETRYGKTHIVSCGDKNGKTVVLWHGQNANASTWARWIPYLAPSYRIYAVDIIGGMGKSAPTRLSRKGSTYGEWAAEVVQGIGLSKANMVGVSNGGWLLLKLGSVAPEMVGNAILLSSAGLLSINMRLVFKIIFSSLSKSPKVIAERLVELLSPPNLPVDPFYVEFFEVILTSKFRGEEIAPRIEDDELRKITTPTYMLMGQYEASFNPYKAIERGIRLLPNVIAAEIVPDVGHSMEHRQPDWVISRVKGYLDKYAV
jgi:pimeloyl-ACP methyl ester carboxylesterase